MTRKEIVLQIAELTGHDAKTVRIVVESFMAQVTDALAVGEEVFLRGFGSFIIRHRPARYARNITKCEAITVPARKLPAFRPAQAFRDAVREDKK